MEHDPEARILVVTDRDELDKQIEGVMKNAGVIGENLPLVRRLAQNGGGNHPAILNGLPSAIVLFNNLASIPASAFQCPAEDQAKAKLALELDLTMREKAPAGRHGDDTREAQMLNALFPLLSRDREATKAIF